MQSWPKNILEVDFFFSLLSSLSDQISKVDVCLKTMIIPQQGRKFEFSWKVRKLANRARWQTELMPILSRARCPMPVFTIFVNYCSYLCLFVACFCQFIYSYIRGTAESTTRDLVHLVVDIAYYTLYYIMTCNDKHYN